MASPPTDRANRHSPSAARSERHQRDNPKTIDLAKDHYVHVLDNTRDPILISEAYLGLAKLYGRELRLEKSLAYAPITPCAKETRTT